MKTKFLIIITIICFMVIGMQSLFAQNGIVPFERSAGYNVSPPPASQAPTKPDGTIFGPMRNDWGGGDDAPGGGGTGTIAPIAEGCWVLASLAVVYGIVRRKRKKGSSRYAGGSSLRSE